MTKDTLIEYPCVFPIKIIGKNTQSLIKEVRSISLAHFRDFKEDDLQTKLSQKNNYLSITLSVYAENQQMLDAFYEKLTKIPDVTMVL